MLAVAVCAVLDGARSLAAIGEWAGDAPGKVLVALGVRRDLLIWDRHRQMLRLRAALQEFFPAALAAFPDLSRGQS